MGRAVLTRVRRRLNLMMVSWIRMRITGFSTGVTVARRVALGRGVFGIRIRGNVGVRILMGRLLLGGIVAFEG
jgi:hypothetical protein